jgi:pimeloyl-ACP methyl ester carboxylesterase
MSVQLTLMFTGVFSIASLYRPISSNLTVPIDSAGRKTAKIVKNATLKVYPGGQHGMCTVEADKVNADLLEFISA